MLNFPRLATSFLFFGLLSSAAIGEIPADRELGDDALGSALSGSGMAALPSQLDEPQNPRDCGLLESHYFAILRREDNQDIVDEAIYLLAKNYELCGKKVDSLNALMLLTKRRTNGHYYVEANFRVGDALFEAGKYQEALDSYETVLRYGNDSKLAPIAKYKASWALFKMGKYPEAVAGFSGVFGVPVKQYPSPAIAEAVRTGAARSVSVSVMKACSIGNALASATAAKVSGKEMAEYLGRQAGANAEACARENPAEVCRCAGSLLGSGERQGPESSVQANGQGR